MNYLSHLFFSTHTPLSMTGNLMGDFKPSADLQARLPSEVLSGIENHRFVDKKTDSFQEVKDIKKLFSDERKRFSGVITDIAFDYFLIKNWSHFTHIHFDVFTELCYQNLSMCHDVMPPRMQQVTQKMCESDWLRSYSTLEGIGITIDKVSERIRFKNAMTGGVKEIENNYEHIEAVFLNLFNFLLDETSNAKIESSS